MSQDWRIETDARDYLSGQKKQSGIDNRRPVFRKASDLVGPGIGAGATKITDWSDPLATFNGYYSSQPGATNAPNMVETFVGITVTDDVIGGWQLVTGMASNTTYRRSLNRKPADPQTIVFDAWAVSGGTPVVNDYAARYYATAQTALPAGSYTQISLAGKSYDNSGGAFASSAYTCPKTGLLDVRFSMCGQSSTATLFCSAFVNGTEVVHGTDVRGSGGTVSFCSLGSDVLPVNAGDVVTLRGYSGTANNAAAGTNYTHLACRML